MSGYIVDTVNPRDMFDREGNFLGSNSDHWINQALDTVQWDAEGRIDSNQNILNKNKFEIVKQRKRVLYSATGKELFLEAVKVLMQKYDVSKEEFIMMMSVAMGRGDNIKFANPLGLLYGVKYVILLFTSKTQDEYKKAVHSLIENAEKEGIASFDVIRYYRFVGLYITYNPFIRKASLKIEKVPYKNKQDS